MTNAPENFESFVLPDDIEKIEYIQDTKLYNSGTFRIEREDHTIGNLLRMQLMRDPDVVFVAYSHPHPIQHHILLRVQTSLAPRNGGTYLPPDAVRTALMDLSAEVSTLSEQLRVQVNDRRPQAGENNL